MSAAARVVTALLVVAGVIHLLPVSGVLGAERLAALYGLEFAEPNLRILMQHRAVLFGLLGVLILAAAFVPALQPGAIAAALVSDASFIGIAYAVGGYNEAIRRVVVADWVAVGCLFGVIVLRVTTGKARLERNE